MNPFDRALLIVGVFGSLVGFGTLAIGHETMGMIALVIAFFLIGWGAAGRRQ